jgi:monoamine oxidase
MSHSPIIIIGAGLTGLTLAYRFRQAGIRALVLEGRSRSGGRIYTHQVTGQAPVEMGATWLGLKHRHLVSLLKELVLPIFQQQLGTVAMYDLGPGQATERIPFPSGQEPSFRIQGGSSSLINALLERLDPDQVIFDESVEYLDFSGPEVIIRTSTKEYRTERVVSTLPPNLLVSNIEFTPALPKEVENLARQTHTWMGESIKAGMRFPSPFWRKGYQSGTLFSNAGPFTETYDHADFEDDHFAMKGFLHPGLVRESVEVREQLVREQLGRVYGKEPIDQGEYVEYTWAEDPFTYAPYPVPVGPHQYNGHQVFRNPLFGGRLLLAGSETAKAFPGYMDGAVESAEMAVNRLLAQSR